MAIKVRKPNGDATEYINAVDIRVDEGGHLYVGRGIETIAIYAAGTWTRAEQADSTKK